MLPPQADGQLASLRLRSTTAADLPALFVFHCDAESNEMAGTKPRAHDTYFEAWERNLADPSINSKVIELDGEIVGSISRFQAEGRDCVGYWIAKPHWGRGIGSRALSMFLAEEFRRPLHATAARANTASHRILEKCGFRRSGSRMGEETDRYVACEIVDFVLE